MTHKVHIQPTGDSLNKLQNIHMMDNQAAIKKPILEKYLGLGKLSQYIIKWKGVVAKEHRRYNQCLSYTYLEGNMPKCWMNVYY